MNQKIILLFSALLFFGFSKAQVSKQSYEKAVDLLNCKTVELSLPKQNIQQYQQQCPCNETDFEKLSKFLNSVGKLDATIALSSEINSLKKSFKENWTKEDVVTFLSESIFTGNKYQKIIAFSNKRKDNPVFNSYKTNIATELTNILNENTPIDSSGKSTNSNIQETMIEFRLSELEKKQNPQVVDEGSLFGSYVDYLILFAIILSVISLIIGIAKLNVKSDEISIEVKKYVDKKIDEIKYSKSFQINSQSSADHNDNRIRDLQSQIDDLKYKLVSLNNLSNLTKETVKSPSIDIRESESKIDIFFLSTPNSDGSFNESSVSLSYKDGATIYRFKKISSNRASFQIDEKDASIKLALQYPDKNIDPVCEAVNAFNPKATRILTVESGEAELQNGKWIVEKNKKAKVKYEN